MLSGERGQFFATAERVVQIIKMEVDEIKFVPLTEDLIQHDDMVSLLIDASRFEAERFRADGNQSRPG